MTNLFVISAPSGTGKTSLIKRALIDLIEQKIKLSTSYTTRKRRPEEKNGESYFASRQNKLALKKLHKSETLSPFKEPVPSLTREGEGDVIIQMAFPERSQSEHRPEWRRRQKRLIYIRGVHDPRLTSHDSRLTSPT